MIDKQRIVILNNTKRVRISLMINKITAWREAVNLTQYELAVRCGWKSQSRISNYESGQRLPGLNDCRKIVSALREAGADCSFDDVFPANESAA